MKHLLALTLLLTLTSGFAKDLRMTCSGDEPTFNIHFDQQYLILELPSEQIETTFEVLTKRTITSKTKLELRRMLGDQSLSNVVIRKAKKLECQELEAKNKQVISFKLNGRKMSGCCSEN